MSGEDWESLRGGVPRPDEEQTELDDEQADLDEDRRKQGFLPLVELTMLHEIRAVINEPKYETNAHKLHWACLRWVPRGMWYRYINKRDLSLDRRTDETINESIAEWLALNGHYTGPAEPFRKLMKRDVILADLKRQHRAAIRTADERYEKGVALAEEYLQWQW